MRKVSNEVSGSFTSELGKFGVSPGEYMVIRTLYETNLDRPSEVADFIGFTRGAISKQVQKLVQKGLVVRTEHPTDRRSQHIMLTERARAIAPDLVNVGIANEKQYFSFLGKEEFKSLREILEKIAKHHKIEGLPIK